MQISLNETTLNYEKIGQGHPLILLHGNEEDSTIFDKISAPLALYYTVYAIDTRGHGKSAASDEFNYQTYVDDLHEFIKQLDLKDPYIFGFSDGGIVALMLASQDPSLVTKMMVAGVNTDTDGLEMGFWLKYKTMNFFQRKPEIRMMLNDPDISPEALGRITAEVLCVVGEKDVVKIEHTRQIAADIPNSRLIVMPKQTHSSYVVHSLKLLNLMKEFFN